MQDSWDSSLEAMTWWSAQIRERWASRPIFPTDGTSEKMAVIFTT